MNGPSELRRLLASKEMLVAPGVYDGISTTLAQKCGFPLLYVAGHAVALSAIGSPDIGLVSFGEMVERTRQIISVAETPIIVDADTGYGNHLNVYRTVTELERTGVAGIQLEDQENPKRCGHLNQKSVIPVSEFLTKIRAARVARENPDLVLIARTDSRGPNGLDEAIDRANRYFDAGADLIFIEAPESEQELIEITQRVSAPLVFNVVAGGKTPWIAFDILREIGIRIALVPGIASISAVASMETAFASLKAKSELPTYMHAHSPSSLFARFGSSEWERLEKDLLQGEGEP